MSLTRGQREPSRKYWQVYLIIATLAVVLFEVLTYFSAFTQLRSFGSHLVSLPLDQLFALLITAASVLVAALAVHERRLRLEVRQRLSAEQQAQNARRYDSLTGIANRVLFQEKFAQVLAEVGAAGERLAVLVIDIDDFQSINEAHGHATGDAVLVTVAQRLRAILGQEEEIARLGADEFAVLLPMGAGQENERLFRYAERLLKVMHEGVPYPTDSARAQPPRGATPPLRVSASIGIAKFPRDGETQSSLLQCAEAALAQAKAAGKDRYALYDGTLDACRRQRLETEAQLRSGLDRGEIVARYQPLICLVTGRPVGFEALARWAHPERGLLGAPDFIPIAEDAGLVDRLLTAMLERVCADTRGWPADLKVSVNLSPAQLLDPGLADEILSLLSRMKVSPQRIELEITETALLQDFDLARRTLSALREAGVRMSLDDFGTGYSSLRHLQELPIDKIKVDRSFTSLIGEDPQCRKIIGSMLSLGRALGLTTVAEGVETSAQAEWLRAQGCSLGQGYLFARPLTAQDAGALCTTRQAG